jgi:DNA-3-methyladenine glycosylase II
VGPWTVEMFLIFSLGREDVFSPRDAGLVRAARWLYGDENMSTEEIVLRSKKWAQYRTCASLYLWEAINRGFIAGE